MSLVLLWLWCVLKYTVTVQGVHILPEKCLSYTQPGDIILGGIFPLRFDSQPLPCRGLLSPWAVRLSEAMIFVIGEINRRDDILPNVTLGFDLRDDCRSEEMALWTTLSLIRNSSVSFPESRECQTETVGSVVGIVGTGFSETSIYVAKMASIFHVPVVSYAASSDELSDKDSFPFFLRTYPPDRLQVKVILDLLVHFGWEYIGLLYSLESDGIRGAFALQELAEETGICVAFSSPIREFATDDETREVIQKLKSHNKVEIVVLFGATNEAQSVLRAVEESDLRKIVWIGTTHWGYRLKEGSLEALTKGAFFIRDYRPKVTAFGEYFSSLKPSSPHVSPWFKELAEEWLKANNCSDLSTCPLFRGNTEGLVINTVYAFAHAIDEILRENWSGNYSDKIKDFHIDGSLLLNTLKTIQFNGPYGQVMFDSNGDGRGKYILSNLQHVDGKYEMVDIGWWDAVNDTRLWLRDDMIQWPDDRLTPPKSSCRETCSLGYALITLRQRCCTQCTKCPADSIVVNGTLCLQCELHRWPDNTSKTCVPIIPSTVPLDDPSVVSILTLNIFGLVCWLLTGLGLAVKRGHQVVKATSRELTCIHFTGLLLAYIASLMLFTWAPSVASCIATEFSISISFTMTYAPTLLRVIRIHRIFKIGRVTAQRPRYTSPKTQVVISLIIVTIQIVTSILSATLSPSTPTILYTRDMGNYSEIFCAFGEGFVVSCSLNLAIIAACSWVAFLARRVPDYYNESKFIAVSVYTTLVLCVAAIPVYTTTAKVLPKMATICTVVTLNAYVSLVCLFMSKLCAIACENWVKPGSAATNQVLGLTNRQTAVTSTSGMSRIPRLTFAWGSENRNNLNDSANPAANTT